MAEHSFSFMDQQQANWKPDIVRNNSVVSFNTSTQNIERLTIQIPYSNIVSSFYYEEPTFKCRS